MAYTPAFNNPIRDLSDIPGAPTNEARYGQAHPRPPLDEVTRIHLRTRCEAALRVAARDLYNRGYRGDEDAAIVQLINVLDCVLKDLL